MKIKVYVDWKHEEILSEKDYKEFKDRKINEMADEYFEDNYELNEFLCDDYNHAELFRMTDEEKEKVKADWIARCKEYAEETFENEYEYEENVLEV